METKLDSRQGQFPASFPDTFKDFFAMMSEDEDHLDIFSNLLEDKVIPRANKFNQRRCGGSLRCPTNATTGNQNVGRSNSFRLNRPNSTVFSGSGVGGCIGGVGRQGKDNISNSTFCKHIKYCCLHQQQSKTNSQKPQHHYSQQNFFDYGNGCRTVPDGDDDVNNSRSLHNGQQHQQHQQHQPQQQNKVKTSARHSIILERAFDFESCDDSDTISTTSSTPTIPYSALARHPRLQQHHQQQGQQQRHHKQHIQQQQQSTNEHYSHQLPTIPHSHSQSHSYHQHPQSTIIHPQNQIKGAGGGGAYHTKETAIQRIVQQCGLRMIDNSTSAKTNNLSLSGALGLSTNNISGGHISGAGLTSATTVAVTDSGDISGGGSGCCGSSSGNSTSSGNNNTNSCSLSYNGSNCTGYGNNNDSGITTGNSMSATSSSCNTTSSGSGSASGGGGGIAGVGRPLSNIYMDLNSPTSQLTTTMNKFNEMLTCGGASSGGNRNLNNIRSQKSPILNRRRSSSIAANLLTADIMGYRNQSDESVIRNHSTISHSNTRERISHLKSPVGGKGKVSSIPIESGVLTFSQAMSGAVSPQCSATSPIHIMGSGSTGSSCASVSNNALASVLEAPATSDCDCGSLSPTISSAATAIRGSEGFFCGSSATIAQLGNKQKQRLRTSSMPAESRKPRLADTRRAAIHCADIDLEYYRLRSFSITSHGVCNLGDSLRSRRSRSINSVTSTGTSNSGKDRHNSNASRTSGDVAVVEQQDKLRDAGKGQVPAYKIAMLGASGVGKTALTYQFTTSDYICAYDLSLDDDYGQKTVSVLVDGIETDLEIIDHPACEMSTEAFCSTYNIDLFVVVYSVVDRNSFKAAEKVLQYLKESEMLMTRGAILVGNKTDLERHREVNRQMGRKLAKEIACKFIETSSGLDHNVDELLVGIIAQVKLNPQRISNLSERDRQRLNLQNTIQKHRRMHMPVRRIVRQASMCQQDDEELEHRGGSADENQPPPIDEGLGGSISGNSSIKSKSGPIRKTTKRTLNLESILKMGESEIEDEDDGYRNMNRHRNTTTTPTKKEILTSTKTIKTFTSANRTCSRVGGGVSSLNSSPKSRQSYESSSGGSGNGRSGGSSSTTICGSGGGGSVSNFRDNSSQAETSLLEDCNRKTVSKLTNRTKIFLSSVLKFKKAINVKRRNSSSCSDLFVI